MFVMQAANPFADNLIIFLSVGFLPKRKRGQSLILTFLRLDSSFDSVVLAPANSEHGVNAGQLTISPDDTHLLLQCMITFRQLFQSSGHVM